jgi:hypothetical protein
VQICGEFRGFGFLSFFIRKLITIVTAITAAVITAIAGAIIAATAPTATINTARRRRRRSIDLAAGRRRRSASAAGSVIAAPVIAAAPIRDATIGTGEEEVCCFGLGRNGGGSECESRRGHDGHPA